MSIAVDDKETFFVCHTAFMSSQRPLEVLIRLFNDAALCPGEERATIRRK
jgi:hypothetical protein